VAQEKELVVPPRACLTSPAMQFRIVALLAVTSSYVAAVMVAKPSESAPAPPPVTAAEVAKLHHKMEAVAAGLEGMLKPGQHGSLAKAAVAPAMQAFVTELRATLTATATPHDLPAAMKSLKNAQAGMVVLTKALTAQQETLMRTDASEEANLLLGVLMLRRNQSMAKQLEALNTPDFRGLPVSKALLVKHDEKMPLFQQASLYLDKHGVAVNASSADEQARRLAKSVTFFEHQVEKMTHEEEVMQQAHSRRVAEIEKVIKKSDKQIAHRLQVEKKHVDREFKKRFAMHRQESDVMRSIVSALRRGDQVALRKAQNALQAHLRAMKAQTGNFLYLVQLGHQLESRDCPFCVAQCIGKCHDGGSPYAQCMTQCATAGQ